MATSKVRGNNADRNRRNKTLRQVEEAYLRVFGHPIHDDGVDPEVYLTTVPGKKPGASWVWTVDVARMLRERAGNGDSIMFDVNEIARLARK